jgi:tetratricopeptide (TPR) repeat protein
MTIKKLIQKKKILDYLSKKKYELAKKEFQSYFVKYEELDVNFIQHIINMEIYLKNYKDAIILIEKIGQINLLNANILLTKARILKLMDKIPEALETYRSVVEIDPKKEEGYIGFGILLFELGNGDGAIEMFAIAIKLNSKNNFTKYWMAKCYQLIGKYNEALSILNNLMDEESQNIEYIIAKAELLNKLNLKIDAINLAEKAVKTSPNNNRALLLRATINAELGNIDLSIRDFDQVLKDDPQSFVAKFNKAIALLRGGDYKQGWRLYEHRWDTNKMHKSSKKIITNKPLWQKDKKGKLLVWAEQGIGDEIMFMSIIDEVCLDVEKLWCLVDPRLEKIFERSFNKKIVFINDKKEIDGLDYEFHIPMGSLPMYYRNSINEFPKEKVNYLKADEDKTNKYKEMIKSNYPGKIIGISWDSKNPINGLKRGVSLNDFINAFDSSDIHFLNLQYGNVNEEINEINKIKNKIISFEEIDNFNDIDGLAALIMCCDEVISIDNSTVHLSGALGVKTKIILQEIPDWRWLLNKRDSPWYLNVELIRGMII